MRGSGAWPGPQMLMALLLGMLDAALGRVATGAAVGRIVAVRQGNLLATSFHPELTGDGRIHAYFCGMVKAARQ